MSGPQTTLEQEVVAVFQRACHERDLPVAEHLLCALEVIFERDGHEEKEQEILIQLARDLRSHSRLS